MPEPTLLYAKLSEPIEHVPLACTILQDAPGFSIRTYALAWTPVAYTSFRELAAVLRDGNSYQNIPYLSLGTLLDLDVPNITRRRSDLALSFKTQGDDTTYEQVAFAWADGPSDGVQRALTYWFQDELFHLAKGKTSVQAPVKRLFDLFKGGNLAIRTALIL